MRVSAKLSSSCRGCFADLARCAADECGAHCKDPNASKCRRCLCTTEEGGASCADIYRSCTGIQDGLCRAARGKARSCEAPIEDPLEDLEEADLNHARPTESLASEDAGASSDNEEMAEGERNSPTTLCTPGTSEECVTPDGCDGAAKCSADQTLEACACGAEVDEVQGFPPGVTAF